jgi:hypothetical protein
MRSWAIAAGSVAELAASFGTLGVSVPLRTEKKDQFAEEVYCLRRYLFPLAHNGLLEFPITVSKQETPDFILAWGGKKVGLEITKATRQEFEADLTRFDRRQKTKDYLSDVTTGTMLLDVLGWAGDSVETEWGTFVLDSILNKLPDLVSYPVVECKLLIYDNTPLPAPDLKKSAEAVRLRFAKEPLADEKGRSFRAISVIRDPWLIYDIAHKPQILRYDPVWDQSACNATKYSP